MIGGALIAPTLFGFLWIAGFGGAALNYEHQDRKAHQDKVEQQQLVGEDAVFKGGDILVATKADSTHAIFTLFDKIEAASNASAQHCAHSISNFAVGDILYNLSRFRHASAVYFKHPGEFRASTG